MFKSNRHPNVPNCNHYIGAQLRLTCTNTHKYTHTHPHTHTPCPRPNKPSFLISLCQGYWERQEERGVKKKEVSLCIDSCKPSQPAILLPRMCISIKRWQLDLLITNAKASHIRKHDPSYRGPLYSVCTLHVRYKMAQHERFMKLRSFLCYTVMLAPSR